MSTDYFISVIMNMRQQEDIVLYDNILHATAYEEVEVIAFLQEEYDREALNFPYQAPEYNDAAALWAAKLVYVAAQLLLYRKNTEEELPALLPDFAGDTSPDAILSADLCLRFLPDILLPLKLIDHEDGLIDMLETILTRWHYSGIKYELDTSKLATDMITSNSCLKQLYVNRIIEYRKMRLAQHPAFVHTVTANMGIYAGEFWNDFKIENKING
ncbi:MAG: hypothetical protein EOP51_06145 [Sphingobacteriales bacterium]|nr:MAG: hypothetical protein EOP51_06145 [Sphingobacteriales bacterium]